MKTLPSLDPVGLADCLAEIAGVFGAPLEESDVRELRTRGGFEALAALADDPRHAADLATAFAALGGGDTPEAATSRLNAAYCRLFLGMSGRTETLPIESAHHGDGRLYGEPVDVMAALLAAHNLRPAADFVEPPDHLSVELALLEQLIRLDASVIDTDARQTIAALAGRLAGWTPNFADALGLADPSGFYAALARILVRLLDEIAPRFAVAA